MIDPNSRLNEILNGFDKQTEPINEDEIQGSLIKIKNEFDTDGVKITDELNAEILAFSFAENYKDEKTGWGTFFCPIWVYPNESGQMREDPSIKLVTKEILVYWSKRAIEAKHPIFKSRYAGLVWDFSKIITNENPNPEMARIVIDTTMDIAFHRFHTYDISVIDKLEWALSLSISLNDTIRVKKVANGIISFEDLIAEDDKPGLWGFSFDFLINKKKIPLTEEQKNKIISDLEERLNRVSNSEKLHPFAAEAAAIRLAEHFRRLNQNEKVREVLLKYGNSFLKEAETKSPLVGSAWLQTVHSVYLNFGLKKEADSVLIVLRKIDKRSGIDLKQISLKFEIPKDKLEKFVSEMLKGNLEHILSKIAFYFVPKRDKVENQVKELSREFVFPHLFPTVRRDQNGRSVAQIGPIENDLEGHVIQQMSQNMSIENFYLQEVLEGFKKKFSPTSEDLVKYLYCSAVFEEDKKTIIEKGIKFYLENDFIPAVHLLIPQIEAAFRNLIEVGGGAIYKFGRNGRMDFKTFDEILRDTILSNVFNEDISFYLRILFTDPRGWNIRNSICHGFIPPQHITSDIADRVLHAILLLAQVRKQEKQ
ncbi:MAG: DUF4209 domain-containing protein [Candidatus Aminicenantes bacterium]|nr:DUF4209 domain-containing protein [Candidatus Aminicenantes bacterium]